MKKESRTDWARGEDIPDSALYFDDVLIVSFKEL